MSKVRPFKATIYNPDKFSDLSGLVCPPYDIISCAEQKKYHQLNPYNFIHILLGMDIPEDDKYKRAAHYFKSWLSERVLIEDNKPAVYFYSQDYKVKGEKKTRVGFIALLGLAQGTSSAFAHEHTRLEPKEDRLKLLKAVRANLSPIFVVFADKKRIIQRFSGSYMEKNKPFVDITDASGTRHKLWRFDSAEIIREIEDKMLDEEIFIADGHHRYEVACAFRDLMKAQHDKPTGEEPFNYIMAYFTNTDPRGLVIQPIHRKLKLNNPEDSKKIFSEGADYFDIEEIKDKAKFFFLMEKAGKAEHVIGMYKDRRYWLLRLKNIRILDKIIPDKPKEYRSLDAAILNYIIFGKIFSLSASDKDNVCFSHDAQELIDAVDNDKGCLAFFLNPVTMQQIMSVALAGNKMPPKSTYFYPKVLSGLVINKLY